MMKLLRILLILVSCTLLTIADKADATTASGSAEPRVVRVIDSSNPEPEMYNWHSHNRLGIQRGAFAGIQSFNRVLIRKESGEIVPVPLFHFTLRDLGEIFKRMAEFPAETRVIAYQPTKDPLVHIRADELEIGPVNEWSNHGVLGGQFHSINPISDPVATDILGRRAVKFSHNQWFKDSEFNSMVLDAMPADALRDGSPFTFAAWVLHPMPDPEFVAGKDAQIMMSWHGRGGDDGTGLCWRRGSYFGSFYVDGLGGDLVPEPRKYGEPMTEWTHLAYVYTGGGVNGELRIYENGHLVAVAKSDYVPELREPANITPTSVALSGYLHTSTPDAEPYVWALIGEYDAHHFPQLRHIGKWDDSNTIGRRAAGAFEIPFEGLKPGTRYYYRMFAQNNPIRDKVWVSNMDPTRRWARGSGSFVTPVSDGEDGVIIPSDDDRYIFLGSKWGSRWYAVFGGPAGFFRGYLSEVKLFDYAFSDDDVRREAGGIVPFDERPASGSVIHIDTADFSWRKGSADAASYLFRISADRDKVEDGSAPAREVTQASISQVKLQPGRTHYWRVDQLDAEGRLIAAGPVWDFHVAYGEANVPMPRPGSSVQPSGHFGWTQAIDGLARQRFYLGRSADEIREGSEPVATLREGDRNYRARLHPGITYYWRIENELEDGTVIPGRVWSFQTKQYFTPEFDGPVTEPYPDEFNPGRPAVHMEGMGHPTITNPGADEASIRDIAHATKRFLRKSRVLRNHLASRPSATTMSTPDGGGVYVRPFACGSYGGLPYWNMTMHEMGHQVDMHGITRADPLFWSRLQASFNARADTNAWMGDYASANLGENMAVATHAFICAKERDALMRDDPLTYHLLADFMPGDLAVELHPAGAMELDEKDVVLSWTNRGGTEERDPRGQGYVPIPETVGVFHAAGAPVLSTIQGAAAVFFDGASALKWDRGLQFGFEGNGPWSIEAWVRHDSEPRGEGWLVGWGTEERGVRLYWGEASKALSVCGVTADWPDKPGPGRWHHVALVFEGGGALEGDGLLSLFLNGERVIAETLTLDLEGGMPVEVGGQLRDGRVAGGFSGALANLRIHNYALSDDQVVERHYLREREGYERSLTAHSAGTLLVDLDARILEETGAEHMREPHRPLYPRTLRKPWVRSWSNKGSLQGRVHNDVDSELWHYSASSPLYRVVEGRQAIRFMGKDRMVAVNDMRGSAVGRTSGTVELLVFSEKEDDDEVVLQWGSFVLDARHLKPGWQHVAVIADTDNSRLYIDGEEIARVPGVLTPGEHDRLHLGAYYDYNRVSWYRYFNGAIAEVRVHSGRLTTEQVADNARRSQVFAAHQPRPAHGATVAPDRRTPLEWAEGRGSIGAQVVSFGEDPGGLQEMGAFESGEFVPELSGQKRYFWRVGQGPVWSFDTSRGELIHLSASQLATGKLSSWRNAGSVGGSFQPAQHGGLAGFETVTVAGRTGLLMKNGVRFKLEATDAGSAVLGDGPFTITFAAATEVRCPMVPFFSWDNGTDLARLWFGTHAVDHRLLTIDDGTPLRANQAYPERGLKLVYPEMCRGRLAYTWLTWKRITITYDKGKAEIWYDGSRYASMPADLSLGQDGNLFLGWDAEGLGGEMILNDLRVYNRVISERDINRLVDGGNIAGAAPVLRVTADDLEPENLFQTLANAGSAGGRFIYDPGYEQDRRPEVKTVAGRPAVEFDGVAMLMSDFTLPMELADARPFTVEMKVLQPEPSRDSRILAFSQEISERHTSFAMGSAADHAGLARRHSGAGWQRLHRNEPIGEWIHLAWVYDGGKNSVVRLYRNGVLDSEHDYRTVDTIGGYPMTIGGMLHPSDDHKYLFKGAVNEIRIFDYPRTAEEIAAAAAE